MGHDPAQLEFTLKSTFYYELWMLGETLERLAQPDKIPDQVYANALINPSALTPVVCSNSSDDGGRGRR